MPFVRRIASVLVLLAILLGLAVSTLSRSWAGEPATPTDGTAPAQGQGEVQVEVLPVEGYLDPPVLNALRDAIADAEAAESTGGERIVVVQLNTRTAIAVDPGQVVATLRDASVPVVVFVGPRLAMAEAGGAAALMVLASHTSAIATDAMLGPINPVLASDEVADFDGQLLADLLEARGVRDPAVADQLAARSLTAIEALNLGAVDLAGVESLEGLLLEIDGREVTLGDGSLRAMRVDPGEVIVRFQSLGLLGRLLHASLNPIVIYLALLFALGLLAFEYFQPGFGVAGLAGVVVAALAIYGITVLPIQGWALALLLVGVALLVIDTAIAGLGVPTAAGTVAIFLGSMWLYRSPVDLIVVPLWLAIVMTVTTVLFFVIGITVVLRAQAGPDESLVESLVGLPGVVRSRMNPEGHVFIDGALWRARWDSDADPPRVGARVTVSGVDGATVLVKQDSEQYQAP